MATRYWVRDGNTLGYVTEMQPHLLQILATKGGVTTHGFASQLAFDPAIDRVRPATAADFDAFRVTPPKQL